MKLGHTSNILSKLGAMCFLSALATMSALATTLTATGDAFITTYSALGGGSSSNGALDYLALIGDDTLSGTAATKSLLYFDMSGYSGQTLTGDATFTIRSSATVTNVSRTISIHEVLIPWSEGTVTWNNFGASPGVSFGTDAATVALDTVVFVPTGSPAILNFTVAQSLVQAWIDSPALNYGVLLNMNFGRDVYFNSSEDATSSFHPTLTFTAIPEPTSALLLSWIALVFASRRRR